MACGLSCPVACGIFVPRPGIELASPVLHGGFFTTGPPGKSPLLQILVFLDEPGVKLSLRLWQDTSRVLLEITLLSCFGGPAY